MNSNMTVNPADREAVWFVACHQVRDTGFNGGTEHIDRLTDAMIAALDAARAKRLPREVATLARRLREMICIDCGGDCSAANPPVISCPVMENNRTADFLEALSTRVEAAEARKLEIVWL